MESWPAKSLSSPQSPVQRTARFLASLSPSTMDSWELLGRLKYSADNHLYDEQTLSAYESSVESGNGDDEGDLRWTSTLISKPAPCRLLKGSSWWRRVLPQTIKNSLTNKGYKDIRTNLNFICLRTSNGGCAWHSPPSSRIFPAGQTVSGESVAERQIHIRWNIRTYFCRRNKYERKLLVNMISDCGWG